MPLLFVNSFDAGIFLNLREYSREVFRLENRKTEAYSSRFENRFFRLYRGRMVEAVCRVVSGGYGVASTSKLDKSSIERTALLAFKSARMCDQPVELVSVSPEKSVIEHPIREGFEAEKVLSFLKFIDSEKE